LEAQSDIAGAAKGDTRAFARIVAAEQGRLFAFLGRMGLDAGTAEDIAQEAFLRLWANAARFDAGKASLTTFLITIARNLALNHLARPSRAETTGVETDEAVSPLPGPHDVLALRERGVRLRRALARLDPADRSLLAASYVEGLDHAGIARIEGCSPAAVKQRLHRIKARLQTLLEDKEDA
jgi:RNA polymerase sigma-70 factor, ECF subfamily